MTSSACGWRAGAVLLRETLGQFDQDAPIGRIPDFSKSDDESQALDDVQVDLVVAKQL